MDLTGRVEQLEAENGALRSEISGLVAKLEALEAELERLRRELGRNSSNSGKPPSSDTLTERAKQDEERLSRAERRRQAREKAKKFFSERVKRRPGKQPGTAGATLRQVDEPDRVQLHLPGQCGSCGQGLQGAEIVGSEVRQVFDLPLRRLEVTEHQAQSRRCNCGVVTKASFPPEAKVPANYGPVLRAVGVYLMVGQHLPVARAAELLAQVCGAPVSTGWLAGLPAEAAAGLSPFLDELRRQLRAEDVLHADETGSRISGARYWFHVACNGLLTLLDCHPKRGVEALEDMAVLPFFSGVLVSDGWRPYWSIEGIEHALCCAHLLRDLASLSGSPRHRYWADGMADLLVEAKTPSKRVLLAASAPASSRPTGPATPSSSTRALARCPPATNPAVCTATPTTCYAAYETNEATSLVTGPTSPSRSTITRPKETSGWPSCSRRLAGVSGRSPGPKASAPSGAISRQLRSKDCKALMS